MLQENDLVFLVVEQVTRLRGFSTLARVDDRANEIAGAYEALYEAALLSGVDGQSYINALNDFVSLIVLGEPDDLLPHFLSEIERTGLTSEIEVATVGVLVGGYAVLLLDAVYPSRQDAVKARSVLSAMVDVHSEIIGDVLGFEVLEEFLGLTGAVSNELSRIAASQIPLVRVETGIEMPSTLLAYKLYETPDRASELIERNKVATPVFMPVEFEALSA